MRKYRQQYEKQLEDLDLRNDWPVIVLFGPKQSGKTLVAKMAADFLLRNWWNTKFDGGILYIDCRRIKLKDLSNYIKVEQLLLNERFGHSNEYKPVLIIIDELQSIVRTDDDMKILVEVKQNLLNDYGKGNFKLLLVMTENLFKIFEEKMKDEIKYHKCQLAEISKMEVLQYWFERLSREKFSVKIEGCLKCIREEQKKLEEKEMEQRKLEEKEMEQRKLEEKEMKEKEMEEKEMKDNMQEFLRICSKSFRLLRGFADLPAEFFEHGYTIQHMSDWCTELESDLYEEDQHVSQQCLEKLKKYVEEFKRVKREGCFA